MTTRSLGARFFAAALFSTAICSFAQQKDEESGTPVELSPFVVTGKGDPRYQATSTLAGTRIKSDLKDLASGISVVTASFLEDVGVTDGESLLSYVTSAEVGGSQGNFSGAEAIDDGRFLQPDARANPQQNTRVRGLGRAALTRGYFLTDIAFDSYNTERVTINRGPNSLLFGIGDPGGIIDNGLKQANFNSDATEVKFRLDSEGSTRAEFDLNKSIVRDRLAVRIAGMHDDEKYRQKPAWERDQRLYAAINATLFTNERNPAIDATRLRINGETGRSRGSPVEVIPPSIAYSNWFNPVPRSIAQYSGVNPPNEVISPSEGGKWQFQTTYNPFLANAENQINTNVHPSVFRHMVAIFNNPHSSAPAVGAGNLQGQLGIIVWNPKIDTLASAGLAGTPGVAPIESATGPNTGLKSYTLYHANSPFGEAYAQGFAVPTVQNRAVFDYHKKVYSGGIDLVDRKQDAFNVALEQTFLRNQFGFELAYDWQEYESVRDFFFSGGDGTTTSGPYDIYVDIAQFLPNGQVNPNLGRAYTRVSRPEVKTEVTDRETVRLTAFGKYDFAALSDGWLGKLGRHSFTALFNDYTRNHFSEKQRDVWGDSSADVASILAANTLDHVRRVADFSVYTSGSLLGLTSMDQVRLQQIRIPRPQPGAAYNMLFADVGKTAAAQRGIQSSPINLIRYLHERDQQRQEITSQAYSWQAHFLNNHLVTLAGWRKDETKAFARAGTAELGFAQRNPDGSWNPAATRLSATPALDESGVTKTWSAVALFPEKLLFGLPWDSDLRVHYGQSENFNPVGLRSDSFGNAIGQPSGITRERGFSVEAAGGRLTFKANWFETELSNVNAGGFVNVQNYARSVMTSYLQADREGRAFSNQLVLAPNPGSHPIQSYAQFYTAMNDAIPANLRAVVNPRFVDTNADGKPDAFEVDSIPNQTSTTNRVAEGFELELFAAPTKNWNIILNVGRQQTVQSDTAVDNAAVVEAFTQAMDKAGILSLVSDATGAGQIRTINEFWSQTGLAPVRSIRALDGTVSNEQREWRATGLTSYEFDRGVLKGFLAGGAVRWEGKAATGYVTSVDPVTGVPVPDVSRPFLDDGLVGGDLFFAYSRRISKKIDWRVQLNIRNAFGNDSDIPVKTNPDGTVAVIRIPTPTVWYLTNTFRF